MKSFIRRYLKCGQKRPAYSALYAPVPAFPLARTRHPSVLRLSNGDAALTEGPMGPTFTSRVLVTLVYKDYSGWQVTAVQDHGQLPGL